MQDKENKIVELITEKFIDEYGYLTDDEEEAVCIFEQILGE